MWGFEFIYGSKWILENLFRDGFIAENPDGSKNTWYTVYRGQDLLRGYWKKEDGEITSRQTILLDRGEITEIRYYYDSDNKNPYWIYSSRHKSKNVIDVVRQDKDGNKVSYKIIARRNRLDRVTSYKIQFSEGSSMIATLKYNKEGLLIEDKFQSPEADETEIVEYEYNNQGTIVLQRIKVIKN